MSVALIASDVLISVLMITDVSVVMNDQNANGDSFPYGILIAIIILHVVAFICALIFLIMACAHMHKEYAKEHSMRNNIYFNVVIKLVFYIHAIFEIFALFTFSGLPIMPLLFLGLLVAPGGILMLPMVAGMASVMGIFLGIILMAASIVYIAAIVATSMPIVKWFAHFKVPRYKTGVKVLFCILEFIPLADLFCGFFAGKWMLKLERECSAPLEILDV
jgi:hypothetical protein